LTNLPMEDWVGMAPNHIWINAVTLEVAHGLG
jgi:hypothetical protein